MKLNEFISVSGRKVILVPYKNIHVPKYHQWMQRKDLQEATASEPLSEEEEYQMQQTWLLDEDKCTFIILDKAVMDTTKDELGAMIGDVNLYLSVQNDVKVGECGIMIAENDARGQGKGMEALLLMLRFGCEMLKIGSFEAKISLTNTTSLSLFEKIGFTVAKKSDVFMEATLVVDVTAEWKRWLDQETSEFSISKYSS
ncbi:hypothetical protein V9T40_002235 [Parthenolecanium corni]|uniref:N-acetyltransferase domain-containing protein n=1 Tax=Parthenolecanium corni TaxID=536013 RepID=A0AAN9TU66_9HEMI